MICEVQGKGYGGMDFMEFHWLVECLYQGTELDMDVYDVVAWSAIFELSECLVVKCSKLFDVFDFICGRWKKNKLLGIIGG